MSCHNTVTPCRYNTCVDCAERDKGQPKCPTCGWNPEEAERRKAEIPEQMRRKDFDLVHEDGQVTVCGVNYLKLN